ncbi:hypothetical protein MD484_g8884, partial [Candolleomyces efflorescens]
MKKVAAANSKRLTNELSKSNKPPSDQQNLELRAGLGDLEAEFRRIVGKPFASDLPEKEIPSKAKGTWDAIRAHRFCLSPIRLITAELWQTIFQMLLEVDEGSAQDKAPTPRNPRVLATLCRVARHWRSATITHCRLWTEIPLIWIYSMKVQSFEKLKTCVRLFIARSGALPLTFTCSIYRGTWKTRQDHVREILRMLVKESHRWEEVSIRIPFDAHEELVFIRGKLPVLSKLALNIGHSFSTSKSWEVTLDYFQDAPSLREVDIDARYVFEETNPLTTKIIFKLPVSQLESYKMEAHCDELYSDLFEKQNSELRIVEVMSTRLPKLPSTPLTLSRLEKIDLRTGADGSVVLGHLESLTLPALADLEIRARFELHDDLYDRVLALIRRSGCSLTRLALDNVNMQVGVLADILSLSPKMEELDFFTTTSEALEALILDQESPSPTVPRLKKLTLRSADRDGFGVEILDGAMFMRMSKSRMAALEGTDPEVFQPLEEIRFVWHDDEMLQMQLNLFESTESESMQTADEDEEDFPFRQLATTLRTELKTKLVRYWHPRRQYFNLKLHMKLDKHMRKLEGAKLTEGDSLVLTVSVYHP